MEHLPLPRDARLGKADIVPFFGHEYDANGSIFDYHTRVETGVSQYIDLCIEAARGNLSARYQLLSFPPNASVLQPILQSWLFFGLLDEVFGSETSNHEFLQVHEGRRVITTAGLPERLDIWILEKWDHSTQSELQRLYHSVMFVWYMLRHLWHSEYDQNAKLSIATSAEMVSNAIQRVAKTVTDFPSVDWVFFLHPTDAKSNAMDTVSDMIECGWCPFEASMVLHGVAESLCTRLFYNKLKRQTSKKDHTTCTKENCNASKLQVDKQRTSGVPHERSDCACDLFKLPKDAMAEMIRLLKQDGTFPILRINGDVQGSDWSIDVASPSTDKPFIAISHVFADGLGNEDENAMHKCKLSHVLSLIRSLGALGSDHMGKDVWLWIDTYCCPRVDWDARSIAISQLFQTFQAASKVLVLDVELQQLDTKDMEPFERAARIFKSGWMHRMWTLPEGTLPTDVWVQFQDRPVHLFDLWYEGVEQQFMKGSVKYRALTKDMIQKFQGLRSLGNNFRALRDDETPRHEVDLALICSAMAGRLTTRSNDEPICVAFLVGLDTSELYAIKDDELRRKKRMWELLANRNSFNLPKSLAFVEMNKLTRLTGPGFQWAPSTLGVPGLGTALADPTKESALLSTHDPKGLHLETPGCLFRMCNPCQGIDPQRLDLSNELDAFPLRLQASKWILLARRMRDESTPMMYNSLQQQGSKTFALLRQADGGPEQNNLLATLVVEQSDIVVVKPDFNVVVRPYDDMFVRALEAQMKKAEEIKGCKTVQEIASHNSSFSSGARDQSTASHSSANDSSDNDEALKSLYETLNTTISAGAAEIQQVLRLPAMAVKPISQAISGMLVGRYAMVQGDEIKRRKWCVS